ncbi:MAG: zinc ABC transporter substrate-binding protein, partial [Treponema sp.]|nr:zinc ABC transporter substrate-binding protein [Treponema sp.]
MKKIFIALSVFFLLALCAGCNKKTSSETKPIIMCSTFPVYDWTRNILGDSDSFELKLLNSKGTDMHSFQPTVKDLAFLSSSKILFYIGGESEAWIQDALAEKKNKNQQSYSMLKLLGEAAKFESKEGILEGKEPLTVEEQSRSYTSGSEAGGKECKTETEYDEHVWLSLKNAEKLCAAICDILSLSDSDNTISYKKNFEDYRKKLVSLDIEFNFSCYGKTVLVADRFPFRYLFDDYNINYFAAFPGCSAETEASFQTVINLSNVLNEYNLRTVYVLENSGTKMAHQIIQTSGFPAEVQVLDSIQNISSENIANGETYLNLMEKNLKVLKDN